MTKKLSEAYWNFMQHFDYEPEFPENIDFDQDSYADELLKCVEDDFDYTIEKYGTVPRPYNPEKDKRIPDYID